MADVRTTRCPNCAGLGKRHNVLSIACGPGTSRVEAAPQTCWHCGGLGTVPVEQEERRALGQRVREARVHQAGLSQKDFAPLVGTDPYAYSKAENLGVGEPELFERMAAWLETHVAAEARSGRIRESQSETLHDLDARVARSVFGHQLDRQVDGRWRLVGGKPVRPYSTDMAAAGLILDRLIQQNPGAAFMLEYQPTMDWPNESQERPADERWRAGIGISGTDMAWRYAHAATRELAICRVAIALVGEAPNGG